METLPDIAHAPTIVSSYIDSIPPSVHTVGPPQRTHLLAALELVRTVPVSPAADGRAAQGHWRTSLLHGWTVTGDHGAPTCPLLGGLDCPSPPLPSPQASSAPGKQYKTSLVNALTLHIGTQAIDYLHGLNTTPSVTTVIKTTHFALYKQMILELDTEGLSCAVNY